MKAHHLLLLVTYPFEEQIIDASLGDPDTIALTAFLQNVLSGSWRADDRGKLERGRFSEMHTVRHEEILELDISEDNLSEAMVFLAHARYFETNHPELKTGEKLFTFNLRNKSTREVVKLHIGTETVTAHHGPELTYQLEE